MALVLPPATDPPRGALGHEADGDVVSALPLGNAAVQDFVPRKEIVKSMHWTVDVSYKSDPNPKICEFLNNVCINLGGHYFLTLWFCGFEYYLRVIFLVVPGVISDVFLEERRLGESFVPQFQPKVANVFVGADVPADLKLTVVPEIEINTKGR